MRMGTNDSFGVEPIREGSYVPDVVIFLNPSENLSAIRECTLKNIPTVGIVDSDIDPRLVTYPIPANMEVSHFPNCHIRREKS
jgi:small subunit ribosomal protein S2